MRTTIAVDDQLLEAARVRAHESGVTFGQLVEEALRRELARPTEDEPAPPVPVFDGCGGVRPGVDAMSNRALAEALDEGQPLERLR